MSRTHVLRLLGRGAAAARNGLERCHQACGGNTGHRDGLLAQHRATTDQPGHHDRPKTMNECA